MTYQEERFLREQEARKRARKYRFEAVGFDRAEREAGRLLPEDGELVVKTQPYGCPKNGTMGHAYISSLDGEFYGLVLEASLRPRKGGF